MLQESSYMPLSKPLIDNLVGDKPVCIHWFRHGLRLHDNPALLDAVEDCGELYPIFIFDGEVAVNLTYSLFNQVAVAVGDPPRPVDVPDLSKVKFKVNNDHDKLFGIPDIQSFGDPPRPVDITDLSKVTFNIQNDHDKLLGIPEIQSFGYPSRPVNVPDLLKVPFSINNDHDKLFGIPDIQSFGVFAENEEQNQRHNIWMGGESKALDLLRHRLNVEEMINPGKAFTISVVGQLM
ncbi:CRY1-like protein [Mya arenaria]|uniref:CRY1-like protein n=1 Tax=Mya arenaria TaxID=6604 RepID=A0ABY7DAS4_MYAAR|nr:CRY1-like protein [Mya arenaria]